ncbi:MAG: hypothetical protein RI564_02175 [Gracilimonas sp.]|nr:hypothetical protein [Gracilimonas sp.]
MKILIADSGSTKTEWILVNGSDEKKRFYCDGLNPFFMTLSNMKSTILEGVVNALGEISIDKIFFYGSGCGSVKGKNLVKEAITDCFPTAEIFVETDLLGAAKACFFQSAGMACILGTGSNSCLYDGHKVSDSIPSLGFTLGDEGSGGYFGKELIRSYYYKTMPENLRNKLSKEYDMDLEKILENVYKKPNANRYVASFSQFLGDHHEHPFIKTVVENGFRDFAEKQLTYYKEIEGMNVGFVGSIAAFHQDILENVLRSYSLNLSIIVRKPLDRLVEYHLQSELN